MLPPAFGAIPLPLLVAEETTSIPAEDVRLGDHCHLGLVRHFLRYELEVGFLLHKVRSCAELPGCHTESWSESLPDCSRLDQRDLSQFF